MDRLDRNLPTKSKQEVSKDNPYNGAFHSSGPIIFSEKQTKTEPMTDVLIEPDSL